MTLHTVDLRSEAAAEARRLANARARVRDDDERAGVELEADATWIALTRRARLKRSLGRRVCLVWRVAFEDASGRRVESRLVPVLLDVTDVPGHRVRRLWIRSLLQHSDAAIRTRVDAECEAWRAAVSHMAAAFMSTRLAREREIAGARPTADGVASQPGLFDRRAERARVAHESAGAEAEQAARDRRRAIASLAVLTAQPARLLLVLVP